jgi:hypothetical protein
MITLLTSSCRVWSVTSVTPTDYMSKHQPNQVRIFKKSGQTVILLEPEVLGDSLRGYATTTGRPTLALADIDSIAVRKTSWGKTLLLVGGVGAAVALAALLSNCDDARSVC